MYAREEGSAGLFLYGKCWQSRGSLW